MEKIRASEPGRRRGTCELCGAHNRELRIMAMTDFIGWACEDCRKQLQKSTERLFCGSVEWTEPSE